jgi:dolichol-phosphate mannosyltransferase
MTDTLPPLLAIVVPVKDEADNIQPLLDEICAALTGREPFEIVYVDDGSTDSTPAKLTEAMARLPNLRVVRHRQSCGQSQALVTGVKAARAPIIVTLDGDGQNDPADIRPLLDKLLAIPEDGRDLLLVTGQRVKRRDTMIRRVSSRVANKVRARLLNDDTPDTGCGLKIFTRQAFLDMPHFDHMHRFLPALMVRQGGRILSVPVSHRPRTRGASKYGLWDRLWVGIVDLGGMMWLNARIRRPVIESSKTGSNG